MSHYSNLSILLSVALLAACVQTKEEPMLIEANVPIDVSLEEGFDEEFFIDNQATLESCGWQYKDGVLSFAIRFPNKEVITMDGQRLLSDADSKVNINNVPKELLENIQISIGDNNVITLALQDGIYTIDAEVFFDSMDGGSCCKGSPIVQSFGGDDTPSVPRCQDYNGPLGNGQNDQSGLQRIINFIGSDCNFALSQGLCVDEHVNGKGGCFNTHGGKICSELINNN
jgi:hypothetical protein